MLALDRFTHLTFDCYGTLVDWESGILDAISGVLARHGVAAEPQQILRLYAEHEARLEGAVDYVPYRRILAGVMAGIAGEVGFEPTADELDALGRSIGSWPPFPDTVAALERLHARYALVVLSNVDDDLFAETARALGVRFDDVITAQQLGSYKPALENFRHLLERIGAPAERVLHVAQSLYHDHVPAKRIGLSTVWIRRPSRVGRHGVALPADVRPDLELHDLRSLADAAGL